MVIDSVMRRSPQARRTGHARQRGVLLVWLLIGVAVLAAAASLVVTRWSDELRREREQALLEAGDELAGALASYARATSGMQSPWPRTLDDLLEDRRAFGLVRHIRRIPADPSGGARPWALILAADGGVQGVRSTSDEPTLLQRPVALRHVDLTAARRRSEWRFTPRELSP